MTLARIRCFVEAAHCENFTEAAQNLYVPQPSLSKQISLLEEELGVKLFHRVKRKVMLTPAGRYLYDQLKHIPAQTAQAFEQARVIGRAGLGSLLVGVLDGQEINSSILSRLQRFSEKFPDMEVLLERNGFKNLRSGLQNGHYDLIITVSFEEETLPEARSAVILQQRGAFAINRLNPKCDIPNLTLDMLAGENFLAISPEESPNGYALLMKQCKLCGFTPKIVRTLNSLESLILGVEAGMGIALLDRNTRLEKNSEVRMVPIVGSDYAHVSVMWLNNNTSSMVNRLAKELSTIEDAIVEDLKVSL